MIPMNLFFQWKETNSNQLMDSKLRCVFIMDDAGGDSGTIDGHEYSTAKMDAPAVMSSPKVSPWDIVERVD